MRPQQRSFVHSGSSARVAHCARQELRFPPGVQYAWQDEMPCCSLSTWNTGSDKHDIAPLAQALYYLHILNLHNNIKPEQRQKVKI